MDDESIDYEASQEEDAPNTKRLWTRAMVLDADKVEIASGLHLLQDETQIWDETWNQDGDFGAEVDGGDEHGTRFEDNGVCH